MKLASTREVAAALGITVQAVHGLRKRGQLAAVRVGLGYAFRVEAVEDLKASKTYRQRTRRQVSIAELQAQGQLSMGSELQP